MVFTKDSLCVLLFTKEKRGYKSDKILCVSCVTSVEAYFGLQTHPLSTKT